MQLWYRYLFYSGICLIFFLILKGITHWTDGRFSRRWRSACLLLLMVRIAVPFDLSLVHMHLFPQIVFGETEEETGEDERMHEEGGQGEAGKQERTKDGYGKQAGIEDGPGRAGGMEDKTGKQAEIEDGTERAGGMEDKAGKQTYIEDGPEKSEGRKEESSMWGIQRVQNGAYIKNEQGQIAWKIYADYLQVYWPGFFPKVLSLFWVLGVVLTLVFHARILWDFRKRARQVYKKEENHRILDLAGRIQKEYGIPGRVNIVRDADASSPYCTGKRTVVLPEKEYASCDLDPILRHEFMHLCRRDLLKKKVLTLMQIFHWMNPVFFWIKKAFCEDMEFICDECVTAEFNREEKLRYNRVLISHIETDIPAASGTWLNRDVRMIGKRMVMNMRVRRRGALVTALVGFVILMGGFMTSCGAAETPNGMVDTLPAVEEERYDEVDITGDFNQYRSSEEGYEAGGTQSYYDADVFSHEGGQVHAPFFHFPDHSSAQQLTEAVLEESQGEWRLAEPVWYKKMRKKYGKKLGATHKIRGQDGNLYVLSSNVDFDTNEWVKSRLDLYQVDEKTGKTESVKADCFQTFESKRKGGEEPFLEEVSVFADGNIVLPGRSPEDPDKIKLMCFDRRTGKKIMEYGNSVKKYYVGSEYIYMMNEDNSAFNVISEKDGKIVNSVAIDAVYGLSADNTDEQLHVAWYESMEDGSLYYLTPEGIFESDLEARERKLLIQGYNSDMISYISKNLYSFTVDDGDIYVVCGTPEGEEEDEYQIVKYVKR